MAKKTRNDLIFYAAFVVFGILLWFAIPQLISGKPGFQVDSRLFPRLIALLLIFVGTCSAITTWVGNRKTNLAAVLAGTTENTPAEEDEEAVPAGDKTGTIRVVLMAVFMVAYSLMIKPVGFIPTTAIIVTAVLLLQGVRKIPSYIAVYVASGILYCIFRYLLMVQL
ncbi:tripartite tricarboxylate transporter TctB family protein [Marasmitruncus massiliensis]|uniref:tripartite tricarboxylate transporter TctB family protein n=1 Tax=Marasmitruncus massiliensis TaxID=1944642 RepID=UPI000C7B0D65|nr:tripartite tricarboxylate transporter TctB family protein [Marasmitruncus massiliensis]